MEQITFHGCFSSATSSLRQHTYLSHHLITSPQFKLIKPFGANSWRDSDFPVELMLLRFHRIALTIFFQVIPHFNADVDAMKYRQGGSSIFLDQTTIKVTVVNYFLSIFYKILRIINIYYSRWWKICDSKMKVYFGCDAKYEPKCQNHD